MRRCRPKTELDEGGPIGGLKITIYVNILVFVPFFTSVEAVMYVFQVKESIL